MENGQVRPKRGHAREDQTKSESLKAKKVTITIVKGVQDWPTYAGEAIECTYVGRHL